MNKIFKKLPFRSGGTASLALDFWRLHLQRHIR